MTCINPATCDMGVELYDTYVVIMVITSITAFNKWAGEINIIPNKQFIILYTLIGKYLCTTCQL